jgi:hypothetical protein
MFARNVFKLLTSVAAVVSVLAAAPAQASFNGPFKLDPAFVFMVAAVVAVPGAVISMLAELFGARHRPPRWVGSVALGIAVITLLVMLRVIGPSGDSGVLVVFLPPLMSLALVSLVPAPWWRLVAVWCVAIGVAVLMVLVTRTPEAASSADGGLGALYGGALVSMLLWHLGFWLGQHWRRRAGLAPAEAPDLSGAIRVAADGLKSLDAQRQRLDRGASTASGFVTWLRGHPGVKWWLGGAVVFYAGIAALAAAGYRAPFMAMVQGESLVTELFGYTFNGPVALTAGAWATRGLAWSALVGCGTWGAAATAGRFDAGPLAPFRLAALVVAAGALAWIALRASTLGFANTLGY